jgi:hypothetical protein
MSHAANGRDARLAAGSSNQASGDGRQGQGCGGSGSGNPYRYVAAPVVGVTLFLLAVGPGLFFGDSPGRILAGVAVLVSGYLGTGYLVLRTFLPHLRYTHRLSLCTAVGLALLVPVQVVAAMVAPGAVVAVEVLVVLAGMTGLILAFRDWLGAPAAARRVPTLTFVVLGVMALLFCVPSAREMSTARDGSLVIQYIDMPIHAATVTAVSAIPPRNPHLPSLPLHYHYFLCLPAARLVHWTGITATDALYRVVRPLSLLAVLLSFAVVPSLVAGQQTTSRRPVSWLGPLVLCGLPSLNLFVANTRELGRLLLGNAEVGMELPHPRWEFCADMLLGVGGLGLCLMAPMLVCLLCARDRGFGLPQGILFGILVGATVGFNGVLFVVAFGGLAILALAMLLRREAVAPVMVAVLVAAAWGAFLGSHVGGGAAVSRRLAGPALSMSGAGILLRELGHRLHFKLILAAAAVGAAGYMTRVRFALAMVAVAGAMVLAGGVVTTAANKYQIETISVCVTLLAAVGAAELLIDPRRERLRIGVRVGGCLLLALLASGLAVRVGTGVGLGSLVAILGGVAAWYLSGAVSRWEGLANRAWRRWRVMAVTSAGLIIGFGAVSSTQFLWYPMRWSEIGGQMTGGKRVPSVARVEAGIVTSLRALARQLPQGAVLAGTSALVQRDWSRLSRSARVNYWFVYPALAERPVMTDSTLHGYMGLHDPRAAVAAEAVKELFRCRSVDEARHIVRRYGISHILLAPDQDYPWHGCDAWLEPYAAPGSLRVYEVVAHGGADVDD